MALYLISYDIAEKDVFEYDGLWEQLKGLGATRVLSSGWIIPGEPGLSLTILNEIAPHIQLKDRLLIQEVTSEVTWHNLLISDDRFRSLLREAP